MMRGIVIAAGLGVRMRPFTEATPKCLLPIAGRPLLDWTIDGLRGAGCEEVVLITGHAADAIGPRDVIRVENTDYSNNNILHSLMYARDYLDCPCIVSYSDIWVEPGIFKDVAQGSGDIRLAVDTDWKPYYLDRTQHPIDEAENAFLDPLSGKIRKIGKHLVPEQAGDLTCGEFLGLWGMSAEGAAVFRQAFEYLENSIAPTDPFQQAKEWRKSYITDLAQYLVDSGTIVDSVRVERGWAELDTQQDYDRLLQIADRQALTTLSHWHSTEEARHEQGE